MQFGDPEIYSASKFEITVQGLTSNKASIALHAFWARDTFENRTTKSN